jgi:hypothetical protein
MYLAFASWYFILSLDNRISHLKEKYIQRLLKISSEFFKTNVPEFKQSYIIVTTAFDEKVTMWRCVVG